MGSEIDARLARFGPRNVTVLATNGLLRVLPHADPLPPVVSMAEVVASIASDTHPQAVQRAEQLVGERNARRALLLATGLDAGDGIITVFSSIRSAVALYMGRHGGKVPPTGWSDHQAGDAVLKAIALGHLLDLCFPGSEDPVTELAWLPAGRALLAYFAAAEIALPFVEVLIDGEHALSEMLPEHADTQARKLATVVGSAAVQEARAHLPALAPTTDALVACTATHLVPLAKTAESTVKGARGVVDKVGDAVAAGADVLPVYRYLGLRVVAEAAAMRAIRESGIQPKITGGDWVTQYIDAPRRAALPLPPSITSDGWEDPATPQHIDPAVPDDQQQAAPAPPQAPTAPVQAPAAPQPAPPLADATVAPVVAAPLPDATVAAPVMAAAVAAPVMAAATAPRTPVASPPASDATIPPPLPVTHQPTPPVPRPQAAPPVPQPAPPHAPPVSAAKATPPALPPATPRVPPPVPVPAPAAPPLLPAGVSATPAKPPVPARPPSPPQAASPSRPAVPPPVHAAAVAPPTPAEPRPVPPAKPVPPPPKQVAPKQVAPPPRQVAPPPRQVAPPPRQPSTKVPRPVPPPSGDSGSGGGMSMTAIIATVVVVLLLGCGGVIGMGSISAVFMGAQQESDPPKNTNKGSKSNKGNKGNKGNNKGAKGNNKGANKGNNKGAKKGPGKAGAGRRGGKRTR